MESKYSDINKKRVLLTPKSVRETIRNLKDWNNKIQSTDDYYGSTEGMQLLAANCTLITAIGEGINRINHIMPGFLASNFPGIPWADIIGMRNRIAHGYFELDAEIVLNAIKTDIPPLADTICEAIRLCSE